MTPRTFQTKTFDRWGDTVSPNGVLDMALRGSREQWWEIYALARRDAVFRAELRRLLRRADPDLRGGARLWAALLDRLEAHAPAGAVELDGLWIPTLAELIRVKAYLLSDRRAVRDFIDVCALVRTAGPAAALAAMDSFDALYAGVSTAGPLLAFADAAHDDPVDLEDFDPGGWRALAPAYRDLPVVLDEVRKFSVSAVEADAARRGIADQRPDRA